jgi:pimeloyl-ACP methyl ester carboxylesterase
MAARPERFASMPIYHTAAGLVEALEWGDGPELFVLLHAAATESHSLSSLATLLLRPDRRVIAPALDRYGATTTREGSDRVQAHVDVLRACTEIHPAERRVLFGHSMGGLIGLLGAIGGLVFDAMVLYEPIVTAWLRTDLPRDVALWDWDRMIAAEVVRGVSTGDPAGGIAASVTAWNEVPWSDLPSAVRAA